VASSDAARDLVAFAEGLARIAGTGGGAKALAAHLAAAIDAAVLVEDGEWRHVALVGTGRRAVPTSVRDLVLGTDAGENGPVTLRNRDGAAPGLAARIRSGDAEAGWLAAFPHASFTNGAIGFVRLAAAAIGVEMTRDGGGTRHRRRSFWDRLVEGAYDDPIEARDDAASRGIVLAQSYVAVAVEAEGLEEDTAGAKLAELRRICTDALRASSGELIGLERGAGFVFLCPAPLEVDAANARTAATFIPKTAAKAHFGARVVGGVGRAVEAVHATTTVEDAREAMFIARRLFEGSRVMPYDGLGVYPLLLRGGASREELDRFADRILQPLRAYDEKHQTELLRTLCLYFEVGQNVKTAAARLNVHRHTVFYRLRQIAEIGGHAFDNAHDQLALRTAIAIDALRTIQR
jgi:hypothetical protein